MRARHWLAFSGIIALAALEVAALVRGLDGQLFSFVCGLIAGIVGWVWGHYGKKEAP